MTSIPEADDISVLRNPAVGWALYIDAFTGQGFPDAEEFWREMEPYAAYANFLYIRIPWSEFEPEKGKYAWECDENYKAIVDGALERGLRLSLRAYVDSYACYRQATPEFVKDDGADGYVQKKQDWSPYPYDPVFQKHFADFVEAFAAEYDDPDRVDFIDAHSLGWFGEGRHLHLARDAERREQRIKFNSPMRKRDKMATDLVEEMDKVFCWVTRLYSENFENVLLGVPYQQHPYGWKLIDRVALDECGYVMRRDSMGNVDYSKAMRMPARSHFPEVAYFGENVYWMLQSKASWWKGAGYSSMREMLEGVLHDALFCHANTLDLRIKEDAQAWLKYGPDLVQRFVTKGGYRLRPLRVTYPKVISKSSVLEIEHTWVNTARGVLPNKNRRWHNKYKVAFALIDEYGNVAAYKVDSDSEPGDWIEGEEFSYKLQWLLKDIALGTYRVGYAIVDTTQNDVPGIKLAVKADEVKGWLVLDEPIFFADEDFTTTPF